jgi:hypothetical protein
VANSNSALTTSRFLRLGALSTIYFGLTMPISVYSFVLTKKGGGNYIDYDWSRIHLFVRADRLKLFVSQLLVHSSAKISNTPFIRRHTSTTGYPSSLACSSSVSLVSVARLSVTTAELLEHWGFLPCSA